MRKYLLIVAAILVTLGVVALVYFTFFKKSATVLVSTPTDTILPVSGTSTQTTQTNTSTNPIVVSQRLVQITTDPVVPGELVLDQTAQNASSTPDVAVKYILRQSGNVYTYLKGAKTLTRTSNKTIPGIQSASWLPDGSRAFVRYLTGTDLTTVNTYVLFADGTGGYFLNQDLAGIAIASSSILTLASGISGSVASLASIDGTTQKTVFTSPLSALTISFAGKGQYLATTKASGSLSGAVFLVNALGVFTRISGPLNGVTALASPNGKWILVSSSDNGALFLALINTATGESLPLPIATLTEKCTWTLDESAVYCGIPIEPPTNATYPDDWYQGAVHFSDRIWKINVSGRYAELVLDFTKETKENLDATALALDPSNTTLVFVNKNDSSLWSFSL